METVQENTKEVMQEETQKDALQEAQELLQAKQQENLQAFQEEYNLLVRKFGLTLSPVVQITASGVVTDLTIIPAK